MKTLIVVPTYNEANNIYDLIFAINNQKFQEEYSILIVDDNSCDGTIDIIKNLQKEFNNIFLLQRETKLGLASAYVDGFNYGIKLGFDKFIEMDADFSHNPIYLPKMVNLLNSYDVVIGSRNIKGGKTLDWGFFRNLISKGGSLYSRIILKCPIKDLTGGFNGWSIDSINKIGLDNIISKGYSFQIEMKYRAFVNNLKIIEFPIVFQDRKKDVSKMNNTIFIEAFLNILKLKFLIKK